VLVNPIKQTSVCNVPVRLRGTPEFRRFSFFRDSGGCARSWDQFMILMKTHDIPSTEVGTFVQQCIAKGAVIIVVTRNPGGHTCTVSVQQE
jgi:hypothetical protein